MTNPVKAQLCRAWNWCPAPGGEAERLRDPAGAAGARGAAGAAGPFCRRRAAPGRAPLPSARREPGRAGEGGPVPAGLRRRVPPAAADLLSAGSSRRRAPARPALPRPGCAHPAPVPRFFHPPAVRPRSVPALPAPVAAGRGGGARLCSAGRTGSARRRVTQPAAAIGEFHKSRRSSPVARTHRATTPSPCPPFMPCLLRAAGPRGGR